MRVDVEVGLRGRRRPDAHRLVGHRDVQRVAVGLGIDRHRGDPHAPRRLDDPAGDLAPVGDEDLPEQRFDPRTLLTIIVPRGRVGVTPGGPVEVSG